MYWHFPRGGATPRKTTKKHTAGQEADGMRREHGPEPVLGFFHEGLGEAGWTSMSKVRIGWFDNFSRLWAVGVVSSCPVPGPGMIQGRENIGLGM